MTSKELQIYIDGTFYLKSEAKISVYDHGLLYGDGVFEGIRAYNGIVFKLREHIDRLYRSLHTLLLKIPLTKKQMIQAVIDTININGLKDAYVRLVVTRGVGDLGLDPRKCPTPTIFIIAEPLIQLHDPEAKKNGVTTIITWVRRDPVDGTSHEVKSLNYLNSVLGKIEANFAGVDEAICLDQRGFVCEGVGENIFLVKDGQIFTPPISSGALQGITRNVIMKLSKNLGYTVIEHDVTPNQLFNADEVFFTGTAAEVTPIREINKRVIGHGKPGPITNKLIQEFERIKKDPEEGISIN
jgi:branched-chain amino acid aminotransferase